MTTMLTCYNKSPSPSLSPPSPSVYAFSLLPSTRNFKVKMSSPLAQPSAPALPSLPKNRIVLGSGGVGVDYLAAVDSYPKPDDKIRSTSLQVQGGGNAGNALTCAARLGLNPRLISKVADDAQGRGILEELQADRVDTSFLVVSKEGNSPFTYIIVDNETKTRTCIHTPGFPPMVPDDLSKSSLLSALDGVTLFYSDANRRNIPILIDAEKKREGLDDLLNLADYVVCSAKFPQAWTEAPSIPSAFVSMLLKLPNVKFVIMTLGEDGCLMLERCAAEGVQSEELDIDNLLELLKQKINNTTTIPTCISSNMRKLRAKDVGIVTGRLLLGTAEEIPPSELVDTTGAGDAFIGAVLYAASCRAMGARSGLPFLTDPRLAPFLEKKSQRETIIID